MLQNLPTLLNLLPAYWLTCWEFQLDEFYDNPEVAKEGLQSFVAEVATAMQSSVAQNPDRTQVIQTSVDAVLETLQSRGLNLPDLD